MMQNQKRFVRTTVVQIVNDYQEGHCHYFAVNLHKRLKLLFPQIKIQYCLVEGYTLRDEEEVDILIHSYVSVHSKDRRFCLIDSEGVYHDSEEAKERAGDWGYIERMYTDNFANTDVLWRRFIPNYYYHRDCNIKTLKKDVEQFIQDHNLNQVLESFVSEAPELQCL